MNDIPATIESLFTGKVLALVPGGSGDWWDKSWQTSFYKEPVTGPAWLGYEGFRTDEQADRRAHGGVDRAVCVYPAGHYAYWRGELDLPDFPHGAFGENITVSGLPEDVACIGDIFAVGGLRLQISQPRQPCWKLARRWRIKDLTARVEQTGFTGYYFRVLHHGAVGAGDRLTLLERPMPEWTIARCNEIMNHRQKETDAARALAACPLLAGAWRDALWARAERGGGTSPPARLVQPG